MAPRMVISVHLGGPGTQSNTPFDSDLMMIDSDLDLLYRALSAPIGLLIVVNQGHASAQEITRARARLYACRREALDPELQRLQIRLSSHPEGQIIITKSGPTPTSSPLLDL